MSNSMKKKDLLVIEDATPPTEPRRSFRAESRKIRKLNPLGMRVVVQLRKDSNVTETGLYLPEGAKQAMSESVIAEVIEVASALDDHTDEETNVSGVPLGAVVLIMKDSGVRVPWDDALRIVETKDILAVVNEISLS
jgi:co-chaperonin GroES (HSP10)